MNEEYMYAKFWRCALQVNPTSYNELYRGKDHGLTEEEYNQNLLQKCLQLNIKIIGIADHGNVDSIDNIRCLLQSHGIIVFPGFEIASNDKIHYVCLFSEDTTSQKLERYLGSLVLLDPENGVRPSKLSSEEIIEKVDQLGGFIYAAHCTQEHGLLKNRLNHIWKLPKLRAVQIPGSIDDFQNTDEGLFYRRVLLNKDQAYYRERQLAIINAKDVATPDDLKTPSSCCLVKMTKPTFSAFKMAFLDPESRIRLNSDEIKTSIGKILQIKISGGYLDGLVVNLSDHLNTLIGGRGTGKSTLLECIRYALAIRPKGNQAAKIHDAIIKENLGREAAQVELIVVSSSQNGRQYKISRAYGNEPIVRDFDGNVSELRPIDLLPNIDIYGQNEIFELAHDEASRIKLLNRFLPDAEKYDEQRSRICRQLKSNQHKLEMALSNIDDLSDELAKLPRLQEELKSFEQIGIKEKLSKSSLIARERQIVNRTENYLLAIDKMIDKFQDNLPSVAFESTTELPDRANIDNVISTFIDLREIIKVHLQDMKTSVNTAFRNFSDQKADWEIIMQDHETEFQTAIKSLPSASGKNGREIGVDYKRLVDLIEEIKPKNDKLSTLRKEVDALKQERSNLLSELSDTRSQWIQLLQKATKSLNKRMKNKIKVEVLPDADRTPLIQFLIDCQLDGIKEKRLSWINDVDTITPSSLVQAIKNGASDLIERWKITPSVAEALAKLQRSQLMQLESLELGHRVDIFLNIAHGDCSPEFRPLRKLSIGQQCTAILHMLLIESQDPLLMDQPEDNLDNAFIAERIVKELRSAKTTRQFLFATHNANIPVFGDAEWIGVFSNFEGKGILEFDSQGSIDVPAIRDHVANILEGGREAFVQRKEKYEF